MSRSYAVLGATLVGLAGLVGIVHVVQDEQAARAVPAPAEIVDRGDTSLADELRDELGLVPVVPVVESDPDCVLPELLEPAAEDPAVRCLKSQLIAAGALLEATPDTLFDATTEAAVRRFQEDNGLVADGTVGPQTATRLAMRLAIGPAAPDPATCPATGRAAVIDRLHQRNWLCDDGDIASVMPMTSAISQPDPGEYEVYAKDMNSSSELTGAYSTMTHFVAFTHGKYQGARIAFHSVPVYPGGGGFVQPLASVGTQELFGDSAGCVRLLPTDAERIWDWLDIGDAVIVVT